MDMDKNQPRIYGYIFEWRAGEDLPVSAKEERIRQRAAEIDGRWVQCRVDRPVAGKTRPFDERQEARQLRKQVKRDDWLIVWRIDSFGDSVKEILETLRLLGARRVNVCVLDHGGDDLEITSARNKVFQKLLRPLAEIEGNRISRRTRAALQFRKEAGLAYTRQPPYGKKRSRSRMDGQVLRMDQWADRECGQIREITARHDRGEAFNTIAADFLRRREKTATGKPWVRKPQPGKQLNTCRIRRAYHHYKHLLAAGRDLYDLPTDRDCG